MEFVNGSSISARTKFDIHDAVDMYFQIKVIIEDLAEIGISHNNTTVPFVAGTGHSFQLLFVFVLWVAERRGLRLKSHKLSAVSFYDV